MRSKRQDEAASALSPALSRRETGRIVTRTASRADLEAMLALENKAFATDRMTRRSLRRLLGSPSAAVLVALKDERVCGGAIVLTRSTSDVARLYSIAVDPDCAGRGVGPALLAAAEEAAMARDCQYLRLEVHENNARAIARYRKAVYREFGRRAAYYEDRGDALRFEKRLVPQLAGLAEPPPYFPQTTGFTGGPACLLMALAWADRDYRPSSADEFRLWREAAATYMSSGPGGCEPLGLALALKRRGLSPEVFVTRPGPYFLDMAHSADTRRAALVVQADFVAQAQAQGLETHLTWAGESVLMPALDAGAAAIVLVAGPQETHGDKPRWVFVFGREGRFVLAHDPAAMRDEHGRATAPETLAVPLSAFMRMTRGGSDHLGAAILFRKGSPS